MPSSQPIKQDSSSQYLPTTEAYDLWASIYDTDGNFLQALDTIEMKSLLPQLHSRLGDDKHRKIVDLGCGTGRNTKLLAGLPLTQVVALDASPRMLDIARTQMSARFPNSNIEFAVFDMLNDASPPKQAHNADGVVSTLVLEHVPADAFFRCAARMLKPGGILLLTNMHSEMGAVSQAGFIDPKTGTKIRPTSYAHAIEDVVAEAQRQGLKLIEPLKEVAVDGNLSRNLGERAQKWVGITVWFGGLFQKAE